ncbi:MAG: amidase family protein, partial [Thermodesulfobacteriota bacterium]
LQRAWGQFFTEWDAVLTPTWTQLPFEHGYDISSASTAENVLELIRPVLPGNALGLPSAAVPAGVVDGLPVGVLVTGALWHDLTCLDIAETIEAAELVPQTPIDPVT